LQRVRYVGGAESPFGLDFCEMSQWLMRLSCWWSNKFAPLRQSGQPLLDAARNSETDYNKHENRFAVTDSANGVPDEISEARPDAADFTTIVETALNAEHRGDWAVAFDRWDAAAQINRGDLGVRLGQAKALNELGRLDEARSVLTTATEDFPAVGHAWHDLARVAERQKDWEEAQRCWRAFIALANQHWWAFRALAFAQREQGHLSASEDTLAEALSSFPDRWELATDYARQAEYRCDWAIAVDRWKTAAQLNEGDLGARLGQAKALNELGRLDEARSVLTTATEDFPAVGHAWHDLARVAERQNDWDEAERSWRAFIALVNQHWWAHTALANALSNQARVKEAIDVLTACSEGIGAREFMVNRDLSKLLCKNERVLEAIRLVENNREIYAEPDYFTLMHDLRMHQIDYELSIAAKTAGPDILQWLQSWKRDRNYQGSERDLFMIFESLGGIEGGCEFAAVQGGQGASPLSLLRWSGMALPTLLDMLEAEFRDFGELNKLAIGYFPEQAGSSNREYAISDLSFGATLHSHVHEQDIDPETFKSKLTRRLVFLREKLKSDLARPEKIFVFKHSIRALTDEELTRLSASLDRYGNNNLLLVLDKKDCQSAELPRLILPHVWISCIDFSQEFEGYRMRAWKELCEAASRVIPHHWV
jgi:tetratricopeptide (TPR) repeat protein